MKLSAVWMNYFIGALLSRRISHYYLSPYRLLRGDGSA